MGEEYVCIYTLKYYDNEVDYKYYYVRGMVVADSMEGAAEKILALYPKNSIEDLKISMTDILAFGEFISRGEDEDEDEKEISYTKELEQLIAFAETGEY